MYFERAIVSYLRRFHGIPTDVTRQYDYYRCEVCRGLVTWNQIRAGGCKCGTGARIRAAHLSLWEKTKLLLIPWMI